MKKKIVFTEKCIIPQLISQVRTLPNTEVAAYDDYPTDTDQLYLRGKDAKIIVVDIVTQYQQDILSRWDKLETIVTTSVGINHIDTHYCQNHGIQVINFPGFNSRAVAEMAFANLISLLRKVPQADAHTRAGGWDYSIFQGEELKGKILGVIGAGNIGTQLIQIGQGLGMQILCNTKHPNPTRAAKLNIDEFVDFDRLISKADFIILAIPATKETEKIINKTVLKKMKPSAYLINPARPQLIDTLALARAIYTKEIAGAALDVIGQEPFDLRKSDLRIQEMVNSHNVILTPHIAWNTKEALKRLRNRAFEAIKNSVEKG
jgi:phosphoglycerate dehydrogenase-like enzyme